MTVLDTAVSVARDAGHVVRKGFGNVQKVDFKGEVNPVTEIDTTAEALISERLHRAFPDHLIHGEENGGSDLTTRAPIWLVDPLDGTNNFVHGFPYISVSIGLLVEGVPTVGVVYDPLRHETFTAWRGGGAMCNGEPIHVSPTPRMAEAMLATGFAYNRRIAADNNTQRLDHFLRRTQGVRRAGSAALDLAYVACGRLDGYWEWGIHAWDIAAGMLLVKEAGGHYTDYSGETENIFPRLEMVASNGLIHAEMLRVIRDGAAAPHPDFPDLVD